MTKNGDVYGLIYDGNTYSTASVHNVTNIDSTVPILELGTASSSYYAISVPITSNGDPESGITSTICEYGTSTSYGNTANISSSACNITNLSQSTTYYYRITTTNGSGLKTVKTGSKTTTASSGSYIPSSSSSNKTSDSKYFPGEDGNWHGYTSLGQSSDGSTVWVSNGSQISGSWGNDITTGNFYNPNSGMNNGCASCGGVVNNNTSIITTKNLGTVGTQRNVETKNGQPAGGYSGTSTATTNNSNNTSNKNSSNSSSSSNSSNSGSKK